MKEKIKKHKKLCIILLIVLLLGILLVSCVGQVKKAQEEMLAAMNQVQTAQVERRTLVSSISATGEVDSVQSKNVVVNLSGVEIINITVEVGDIVEAGTLLCEFDSEDIEENLANAKASLNAAASKTQMDISSAERSLAEAEVNRNIELERADADLADAWNDYLKALNEQQEAETAWQEAKQTTIEKNGEYEHRKTLLAEAGNGASGQSKIFETEFGAVRKELETYLTNQGAITIDSGVMDRIYISSPDLPGIAVGAGIAVDSNQDADGKIAEQVNAYLGTLKNYQAQYQAALSAESHYASLQQEVSAWQTKYNTAKQAESSAEAAYEQAVSAAEGKLDAYNSKVRAKEDTQRNQDSTVQTRTDSLASSRLNATTSTLSDEQKVEEYQEQLENCTLEAPFAGIITAINADVGDTYTGGTLFVIEDVSSYEVSAEIDEYDIGKIKEGQTVVIKTNGTGDEELKGTVLQIAPRATASSAAGASSSQVTYNVRISINTRHDLLKLDMTAKLSIILDNKENVLTVPYEAIQEDEEGKYYVEVMDAQTENQVQAADAANVQPQTGDKQPQGEADSQPKGEISQSVEGGGQQPGQSRSGRETNVPEVSTRRVYVEKGIESDYYIEVVSDEITEGMEVVVPRSQSEGMDIMMMMQNQGPMGGF